MFTHILTFVCYRQPPKINARTDRHTSIHLNVKFSVVLGLVFILWIQLCGSWWVLQQTTSQQQPAVGNQPPTNTLSLWSTWNPTEGHGRTFIEVVTLVWHYFTDTEVVCQQDCRRMWAIWGDNSSEWEVPLEIFSRKVNVKSFIICHCQNNDNKIVCLMVKLFMRYLLSNLLKRASLLPEKPHSPSMKLIACTSMK